MFETSIEAVKKQLKQLNDVPELSVKDRGILEFQSLLLEDESLHQGIETCLLDGLNLPESLNTTFAVIRSKLEMSKNAYVAARAADCDDLRQRLLSTISQLTNPGVEDCYAALKGKIVLCQQIYPSEVIMLYKAGVKGIVSAKGTASSHAEILMQSFNIPSLANIEGLSINILKGRRVMIDVEHKNLIVDLNTRITIKNMETEAILEYSMTSPEMADLSKGRISITCPLGQGLLGSKVGETPSVPLKDGFINFQILSIEPESPK